MVLNEFDQLAGRAGKAQGGLGNVKACGRDDVQGQCQHGWEIGMFGVARDSSGVGHAAEPQGGADLAQEHRTASVGCQFQAEAEEGNALVLELASALAGVGLDASRFVAESDFGFDLVSMLSTWALRLAAGQRALRQEDVVCQ